MTKANRPLPYADDVEAIPADEADDTRRVIQALELILARNQAKSGQFRADVHVKTHGYAEGEFRVLPNLPEELAQGLFAHDGVYPAVVRFSNAASQAQVDAIPDGRGMAIKVLEVEGDVVLADEQSGQKANPRIVRSLTSCSHVKRSNYYGSKTPITTSRSAFGMRSPHIALWEASTASAAGPTPSRAPGVVSKQGRSWQSRRIPAKSPDTLQRAICLLAHQYFQPRQPRGRRVRSPPCSSPPKSSANRPIAFAP
jgi:hypothetical protein